LCSVARLGSRLKSLTCVSAHPPIRGYRDIAAMPQQQRVFTILPKVSMPLLRFLAKTGDRKLKREGPSAFPRTVFADAEADLKACEDPELLKLFWAGHHFHVENGSDGFITDCQLAASTWIKNFKASNVRPFFMHGNANATIQTKRVAEFASSIDAELKILGGAGHSLPFTHWRELFSAIEKY
ncbi:MAG: alpha/beta hydrolase, partial [Pseudomonadota bacterium]